MLFISVKEVVSEGSYSIHKAKIKKSIMMLTDVNWIFGHYKKYSQTHETLVPSNVSFTKLVMQSRCLPAPAQSVRNLL